MKKLFLILAIIIPTLVFSQSSDYSKVKKYAKLAFYKYNDRKIKNVNVDIKEWDKQGSKYYIKFKASYEHYYTLTGWSSESQLLEMYCDFNGDNLKIKGSGIFSEWTWSKFGSVY